MPDDKIIEAHGSFARQGCIDCSQPYSGAEMREHIAAKTIPRCESCKGLVKPGIVFFGEQLPAAFFENRMLPAQSNLCIVLGTSLTVQPFASLPQMTRGETPRLLINQERVGNFGTSADDVIMLGDCDDGVRKLAKACGWLDELEALWADTGPKTASDMIKPADEKAKSKDERLDEEVEKLTREVDETLHLSKWHEEKVRNEKLPVQVGSPTSGTQAPRHESNSTPGVVDGDADAPKSSQTTVSQEGETTEPPDGNSKL